LLSYLYYPNTINTLSYAAKTVPKPQKASFFSMISPTLQNRRQHAAIPKDEEHEFMKAEK